MTRKTTNAAHEPSSFAADLLDGLRSAHDRELEHALARSRIEQRDTAARQVARELLRPELANHVDVLARAFSVPSSRLCSVIALEVGRVRGFESAARGAVKGVSIVR